MYNTPFLPHFLSFLSSVVWLRERLHPCHSPLLGPCVCPWPSILGHSTLWQASNSSILQQLWGKPNAQRALGHQWGLVSDYMLWLLWINDLLVTVFIPGKDCLCRNSSKKEGNDFGFVLSSQKGQFIMIEKTRLTEQLMSWWLGQDEAPVDTPQVLYFP